MNNNCFARNWLRPLLLVIGLVFSAFYTALPLLACFWPTGAVEASYCDNDNDAPDGDDSDNVSNKNSGCIDFNPEKNLGGSPASCQDSNVGQCQGRQFVGNPINTGTGNKFQEEADYIGHGVYPLNLTRYYNSRSSTIDGPFGAKWSHNYNAKITVDQTIADQAKVVRADERTFVFTKLNNVWTADADVNGKLEQLTDNNGDFSGWRYTSGTDTTETYGTDGKLKQISNRAGLTLTLGYTDSGQLASVTDPFGLALTFTYNGSHIASVTDPGGNVYSYTYINGNLSSVTNAKNQKRQYLYEDSRWPYALTGLMDEKNVRYASWTYDADGWAVSSKHADGADAITVTYDKKNFYTDVENAVHDKQRYTFTNVLGTNRVAYNAPTPTCATSPCYTLSNVISKAEYMDGSGTTANSVPEKIDGNLKSFTNDNNHTTNYVYDDTGRNLETKRMEPGRTIETAWHNTFRLPVAITETGRKTTLDYDGHGNLTQLNLIENPISGNATYRGWYIAYRYDANIAGAVAQKIESDDNGNKTSVSYYAPDADCGGHFGCRGQIWKIINPAGHATKFATYNAHGQPTKIIDANGVWTALDYSIRRQLTYYNHGGESTRFGYNAIGLLTTVTRPDGSQVFYSYDNAHRLTETKDSLGNRIVYTLDPMGNILQKDVWDPNNQLAATRSYTYYGNGRLKTETDASKNTTTYTYHNQGWGNLASVQEPGKTNPTLYGYDSLDRLNKITDPLGNITQQSFDTRDNLQSATDANNNKTSYVYDILDNLTSEVSPDRGKTGYYLYDGVGNLLQMFDANNIRHDRLYDALGRLTQLEFRHPSGYHPNTIHPYNSLPYSPWYDEVHYLQYDKGAYGKGRLTGLLSDQTQTDYSYDKHGRVLALAQTTTTDTLDSQGTHLKISQTLNSSYDADGHLLSQTYPSGLIVGYSYGKDGHLTGITANSQPLLSQIAYQPFGPVASWTWGNNANYARSFDQDGRIKSYPLANSIRTLVYDGVGRIQQYQLDGKTTHDFGYDAADRLIKSNLNGFSYDNNGNQQAVNSNNNRLIDNTYDAAGNTLSNGQNYLGWNAKNLLSNSIDAATAQSVTSAAAIQKYFYYYEYNGLNQRVVKKGSGLDNGPYYFVYDMEGHLIGEYDKDNKVRQETVYLDDMPVAVIRPDPATGLGQTYYVQADHLGTPRVILNPSGTPVWRWDNSGPFGVGQPLQDPDGDGQVFEYNLRFPGQYYDKETGLHYNGQRYYNKKAGRYISPDPIGLAGGINPYAYARSNPLMYADPSGLLTIGNGERIYDLPDGAQLPNGGEGVVSMSGPGSPLGPVQCAVDAASNAAPIGKLGGVLVGGLGKVAKGLGSQNQLYKDAVQQFKSSDLSNAGRALTKHPEHLLMNQRKLYGKPCVLIVQSVTPLTRP